MPPANTSINLLASSTSIFTPAIPRVPGTAVASTGSNAVREYSHGAQASRWPTPPSWGASTQTDLLSDSIARSPYSRGNPSPPFIVIRSTPRSSPAAAESSGTSFIPSSLGEERDQRSRETEEKATAAAPTPTMAERKPYGGGGIVPPHIRTAIAESKNASATATEKEAGATKTPETKPAAKELRTEEFARSGFVPAYVLKNIAANEAATPEQRADAQRTLDLDEARRERGQDAEVQGKK